MFSIIKTPLALLTILLSLDALTFLGLLPSKTILFASLSEWLAGSGLAFVLLVSFIENIPILNVYFPGSITILAAMAGTSGDPLKVFAVWGVVSLGAVAGQFLLFAVGMRFIKRSQALNQPHQRVEKMNYKGPILLGLTSFWHPHLASMACLAMIEANVKFKRFATISIVWTCTWNIFWTFFVLLFGNIFSEGFLGFLLVYLFLVIWIVFLLTKKPVAKAPS
ncbi:DedA family protein [Roseobacter sp. CCS2]|uniref:DedA family protein n=1 Tax=Roseobacter sp. CCS2 TaxID=391593 RepID=UPI0000F3E0B7|nr:hypothetical protein [Roseobacter sp. CCS2]EBA12664.1 hypothetical protein RCCS2_15244 [Roseobacter sp. CCS2]